MTEEPEHVRLLREIRELANNKTAIPGLVQNSIDWLIGKYLVEYGHDEPFTDEAETDRIETNRCEIEWRVHHGSGHNGPGRFDREDKAREMYDYEKNVPSYLGKGIAGGGSGKQTASIVRVTTIYDKYERNR